MEQLRVIGSEDDSLVLATESGERFTLRVDEVLRAELRRAQRDPSDPGSGRPSPKDIQARIRAGLTTQEVADVLGIRTEDVARYERPVLAERDHIVGQALAVPVLLGGALEGERQPTFGAAVRDKLAEVNASGERWTGWKEPSGWVVKLAFVAAEVERDARWGFDPRSGVLTPLNPDATQLSRQGALPDGLIPRLRALDTPAPKDESRFDSGAFGPRRTREPVAESLFPAAAAQATPAVQDAAIKRAPEQSHTSTETADLLEALRRRRGQREPLPTLEAADVARPHAPVALFDALEPGYDDDAPHEEADEAPVADVQAPAAGEGRRKGRISMPSWDEIVFGARTEE